jgi:hypothetical protein
MMWPTLDAAYVDEFGAVDPDVYLAAGALWPQAERLALTKLRDSAMGVDLMMKAVAAVTRIRLARPGGIGNTHAYLFQTYKHFVLAAQERAVVRHALVAARALAQPAGTEVRWADVDRKILIEQLVGRMDLWTRAVWESLALGCSFQEIGRRLGMSAQSTRNKYRKRVKRLMDTPLERRAWPVSPAIATASRAAYRLSGAKKTS